jgi:type IV pilus assembly protein PilB
LITATVEGILAQRLVRRICANCREEVLPSAEILADLELSSADTDGKKFFRGRGCDICNRTGYKGRVGLFELMIMTDSLRDMVMQNASKDALREAARNNGMVTLRDHGLANIFAGTTTAEEVIRETILEA